MHNNTYSLIFQNFPIDFFHLVVSYFSVKIFKILKTVDKKEYILVGFQYLGTHVDKFTIMNTKTVSALPLGFNN